MSPRMFIDAEKPVPYLSAYFAKGPADALALAAQQGVRYHDGILRQLGCRAL